MTGINGIPQAFSPTQLRREFNDFKREVEQKLSARKYVSLERITVAEGGMIDQAVGTQLTETVKEKLVVDSENIGEDALNDRVIIGSTVRSIGVASAERGDGTVRESNVSAELSQRVTPWSAGAKDKWPGLWLEGAPIGEPNFVPPLLPAGVTLADAWGGSMVARSSRNTQDAAYGEVVVGPGAISLNAFSAATGNPADFHRPQTQVFVGQGRFHMVSADMGGVVGAEVRHNGDGILRLAAPRGVLVNGQPIGSGGGTAPGPWIDLPLINGWRITNSNKMRPSYRVTGDTIEFRGSISGGTSNIICRMPVAERALKEENKVVPQYNAGWVNGTVSVAPDGYIRLDTYASNVYSVNLDFSYSTSP